MSEVGLWNADPPSSYRDQHPRDMSGRGDPATVFGGKDTKMDVAIQAVASRFTWVGSQAEDNSSFFNCLSMSFAYLSFSS